MLSGFTSISRRERGKLTPIPPQNVEFDLGYQIRADIPQDVRSRRREIENARISVVLKPGFDESNFPVGFYRLETENETCRLQKLGPHRTLDDEGQQKLLGTRVRALSEPEREG